MVARKCGAPPNRQDGSSSRPDCKAAVRTKNRARNDHYADSHARRIRVLNINALMGVAVCLVFTILGFWSGPGAHPIQVVNLVTGGIFAMVPWLNRFGDLLAPLTFIFTAYTAIVVTCWDVGTGGGVQYFLVTTASLVVLQLGIERIGLAALLATLGVALVVMLQFLVPRSTGLEPPWALTMSFVITTAAACAMVVVTVWFALRDTERAEAVMEAEYARSEALLANMLPASVADRLKEPERDVIADRYEEASVLFADMVGFTERASSTAPCDLVKFLDRLYTAFDELADKHGLEKIKVSGDSYMVVSGVPRPRPDHVQALADFALDMVATAAKLEDPHGISVPLRIGFATGTVVAGVVGSRRFFYDVWGDAVNVAARMESTDSVGQIQVPEDVYERLKDEFVLQERGRIEVKGKGVMRTWYLIGRKPASGDSGDHVAEESRAAHGATV
ncbi:adenylate/guanylate cyclase domain-containing protein [Mycobacterium shigaense]|uniref:adenylate/guanylate cyclase domain-containing protein n=1 Tax=Mycobacterium shigaense TaxID=722731 RepID=UPI000BBA5399|nr:adenylate/guanylate cyclase domain-containing protein [Mycobacterium shigaense]MEA1124621.1 adenylate/guanylate cyclase domain-containing protein [Mycobacterium shigaense]PRI14054.1 adenylate/guanylate cyclase domain-containing protein [Mycobacterium shigaense]